MIHPCSRVLLPLALALFGASASASTSTTANNHEQRTDHHNGLNRKLQDGADSLQAYMRTTPKPTPLPTTMAPSPQPSQQPITTEAPTSKPPSSSPTTNLPTTAMPTFAPTIHTAVLSASEEVSESLLNSLDEDTSLDDFDLLQMNPLGEVLIEFSLSSPNVTVRKMNFQKLRLAIGNSLNNLFCDEEHAMLHAGKRQYEFCGVLDERILPSVDRSDSQPPPFSDDVTIMALATTNVKETWGTVMDNEEEEVAISWTTWRLTWNVLKLGPALVDYITQQGQEPLVNGRGISLLQQMLKTVIELSIQDGTLAQDLSLYMEDIAVLTSHVGDEIASFGTPEVVLLMKEAAVQQEQELQELQQQNNNSDDDDEWDLKLILFIAGSCLAGLVALALLYFICRSCRRRQQQQNDTNTTTNNIKPNNTASLEDTSDSSDEKEIKVRPEAAAPRSAPPPPPQVEQDIDMEVPLNDTEGAALRPDPPSQRWLEAPSDHTDGSSQWQNNNNTNNNIGNNNNNNNNNTAAMEEHEASETSMDTIKTTNAPIDVDSIFHEDLENSRSRRWKTPQRAKSFNSTISAITGASAWDQTESWSVASMDMDYDHWE